MDLNAGRPRTVTTSRRDVYIHIVITFLKPNKYYFHPLCNGNVAMIHVSTIHTSDAQMTEKHIKNNEKLLG
jgi:hypothetical protein